MEADFHRYLIIGGTPRAGTTSLFRWLSKHPQVCASSIKETRFFCDADYPLPSAHRYNDTNLQKYDKFFTACASTTHTIRVEATPDYLYSTTALKIAELLPKSRMVIILRDPVDRLISWFRYAKQRGFLAATTTFEQYVWEQCDNPATLHTPVHLRALDQGRYWKYLPQFTSVFGDRLLTVDFADLRTDPQSVMTRVCDFAEIDEYEISRQKLSPENASYRTRYPRIEGLYGRFRRHLAYALHEIPAAVRILRTPNLLIKRILSAGHSHSYDVPVDNMLAQLIRQETQHRSINSTGPSQFGEENDDEILGKYGSKSDDC